MAAGSRTTLVQRPPHFGATWRLWRLLHSPGRFGLSFGSGHWFRMGSVPTFYMGYPPFSYGGFSFLMVDPWPEYCGKNWYSTDDLYIDYDKRVLPLRPQISGRRNGNHRRTVGAISQSNSCRR